MQLPSQVPASPRQPPPQHINSGAAGSARFRPTSLRAQALPFSSLRSALTMPCPLRVVLAGASALVAGYLLFFAGTTEEEHFKSKKVR